MCHRCEKIVITDIDVRESDLPYLPFKLVKWCCFVDGCKGAVRARDYGISPFYFDMAKRRSSIKKGWRGGWFDASAHFYVCSKHMSRFDNICREVTLSGHNAELFLSKICDYSITKS